MIKTIVFRWPNPAKRKMTGSWWPVYINVFGAPIKVPFAWYRIA
jgi:hypothetical protein